MANESILRAKEPELFDTLQMAARHWDMVGEMQKPIEVFRHHFSKLRKLGIENWGSHPITEGRSKSKRAKKRPPESLFPA